jgi:hypothetical protein
MIRSIVMDNDGIGKEAWQQNKCSGGPAHQFSWVNLPQSKPELDILLSNVTTAWNH